MSDDKNELQFKDLVINLVKTMEAFKSTCSPLIESQEFVKESLNDLTKAVNDIVVILAPIKKSHDSIQQELVEIKDYAADHKLIQELAERVAKLELGKVNRLMKKIRSNEEILDTELGELELIVERMPENTDLLMTLGLVYGRKEKYENALETFERIINIDNKNQHAICLKGSSLLDLDRPEEAFEAFETARKISECPTIYRHEAYSLAICDKHEEAIEHINLAISGDKKDALSWTLKGRILKELDRNMEALGCLENALELQPDLSLALTGKGIILMNLGSEYWEEGLNCLTRVTELEPSKALAWHNKGMALSELGKLEDSIESLDKALSFDKKQACSYCMRGTAKGLLGKTSDALADLNKAFELGLPKDCCYYYMNKSIIFKLLGEPENSLKEIKQAIAIDPENYFVLCEQALILNKLGKTDEAKKCCEQAILFKPTKQSDLNNIAYVLYKLGEHTKALDFAEKAFQKDPRAGITDTMACILFELGEEEKSFKLFKRVLEMKTNDYEVTWSVLVKLYKKMGNIKKAEEAEKLANKYINYY